MATTISSYIKNKQKRRARKRGPCAENVYCCWQRKKIHLHHKPHIHIHIYWQWAFKVATQILQHQFSSWFKLVGFVYIVVIFETRKLSCTNSFSWVEISEKKWKLELGMGIEWKKATKIGLNTLASNMANMEWQYWVNKRTHIYLRPPVRSEKIEDKKINQLECKHIQRLGKIQISNGAM